MATPPPDSSNCPLLLSTGILGGLVKLYRKWPLRPHCNSRIGVHAWTCVLAAAVLPQLDGLCPNAHPGAEFAALSTKCYHETHER